MGGNMFEHFELQGLLKLVHISRQHWALGILSSSYDLFANTSLSRCCFHWLDHMFCFLCWISDFLTLCPTTIILSKLVLLNQIPQFYIFLSRHFRSLLALLRVCLLVVFCRRVWGFLFCRCLLLLQLLLSSFARLGGRF